MYGWPGIGVQLDWQSERTGIENNWYALTGRVVARATKRIRVAAVCVGNPDRSPVGVNR
jgi:hypothetical protein